jgi:abortive infection bacteriophage resistance protein
LDAYIYYEEKSNGLGERFLKQLDIYLKKISENPENFQIKRKRYREAYIKKFPFLIIFEIIENKAIVYSIFNTNRNPANKP